MSTKKNGGMAHAEKCSLRSPPRPPELLTFWPARMLSFYSGVNSHPPGRRKPAPSTGAVCCLEPQTQGNQTQGSVPQRIAVYNGLCGLDDGRGFHGRNVTECRHRPTKARSRNFRNETAKRSSDVFLGRTWRRISTTILADDNSA